MTVKLGEVGRKVSGVNEKRLRTAVVALSAILNQLAQPDLEVDDQPDPVKESSTGAVPSLQDVRKSLQALIDLLPPDAKEQLEGDADGDDDPEGAIIQSHIGTDLIPESDRLFYRGQCALYEALIVLREKDYSDDTRAAMAKKGQAIPIKDKDGNVVSGSYPIADKGDLNDAKQAFGRNPTPAVKAHINRNAKKLGEPPMGEADNQGLANLSEGFPPGTKAPPFGNSIAKDTKCPKCGNIVKAGVAKCPKDGTPMVGTPPPKKVPVNAGGGAADNDANESAIDILGDTVPLTEKALRRDGTHAVKIIQPGWGSSGYYSEAVLQRDGPKVFPKGTKMFWDHPTKSEESERPERSIRDLAAVLVSDARWDGKGPDGPGLYADAQPIGPYAESVEQLAPHIGVSIRAHGKATQGEAEGKKGSIVTEMVKGESVDYVTSPGAGGKILALFESARRGSNGGGNNPKEDDVSEAELKEARTKLTEAERERDRLREALMLREAKDFVLEALGKIEGVPAPAIRRLSETLASDPPLDDDGKLDKTALGKKVKEAVKAEAEYLQSVLGTGSVRGLGSNGETAPANDKQFSESLESSFKMLGYDEKMAKLAATGRQ